MSQRKGASVMEDKSDRAVDERLQSTLDRLAISKYCARGRIHETAETDHLRSLWRAAFARWVEVRTEENSAAQEDIMAELLLRGIAVSTKEVPDAHAKIISEIRNCDREQMLNSPALTELVEEMYKPKH